MPTFNASNNNWFEITTDNWQSFPAEGQAWSYLGIPYVTDDVPAAIMPTLPSSDNMRSGFTYDPSAITTPTFSDGSSQYYVDSATGNDGTAGNSGRGSVALPRETLPGLGGGGVISWDLVAGDQVFVVGDGSEYFTEGSQVGDIVWPGTLADKIWLIGVGTVRPVFNVFTFFMYDSEYFIIDNIDFTDEDIRISIGRDSGDGATSGCKYWAFRECDITGDGVKVTGGTAFKTLGVDATAGGVTEFGLVYKCNFFDLGAWNTQSATDEDFHATVTAEFSRYIWFIENECYQMKGDGYQAQGGALASLDEEDRCHYIYIAGGSMHDGYENAIDNKNSYHVIVSQMDFYNFTNAFKLPNNTAVILSNNDEGPLTGYHWIMFTEVHNDLARAGFDRTGIRTAADQPDDNNYAICNIIHECEISTARKNADATGLDINFINNTCHGGSAMGHDQFQGNAAVNVTLDSNIYSECGDLEENSLCTTTLTNNILHNAGSLLNWDTTSNNGTSDPLFTSPGTGDFTIGVGSSADAHTTEHAAYQLFEDMYGIDIKKDYTGADRPASDWAAGAYEV